MKSEKRGTFRDKTGAGGFSCDALWDPSRTALRPLAWRASADGRVSLVQSAESHHKAQGRLRRDVAHMHIHRVMRAATAAGLSEPLLRNHGAAPPLEGVRCPPERSMLTVSPAPLLPTVTSWGRTARLCRRHDGTRGQPSPAASRPTGDTRAHACGVRDALVAERGAPAAAARLQGRHHSAHLPTG